MRRLGWVFCVPLLLSCDSSDGARAPRDAAVKDAGDAADVKDAGDAAAVKDAGDASNAKDAAAKDAGDEDSGDASDAEDAGSDANKDAGMPPRPPSRVQVFSRTLGYRHESIGDAQTALMEIAKHTPLVLEFTEDAAQFTSKLANTDVVVFLMTSGDVLDNAQQTTFEAFIRNGGGYVGVHSAADTEYDWPFYGELAGAWFNDHPAIQPASVVLEAKTDPIVSFLPETWMRTDEWYNFRANPRSQVTVLLRLDESSYTGGTMGADHPIAWTHAVDKGRAFYTGLGHTKESWQEPMYLLHIERALLWAAKR